MIAPAVCLVSAPRKPQVPRRYGLGEPDPVRADPEDMAVAVHGGGVHGEHDRPAAAGADAGGGLPVRREVHVMPVHGPQALGADRVQVAGHGPVVEVRGRSRRGQSEVDLDRVALAGADPGPLDREAPLVVRGHHVIELLAREPEAVRGRRGHQRLDLHPAALAEREPDPLGLVPQMLREVLRHLHGASFIHAFVHLSSVPGERRITHLILIRRFDPQPSTVIHRGIDESVDNSPAI